DLQAGHDLARGKDADLELVVGRLGDVLRQVLGAAIERVERLGEARRHAPFEVGHRLGDGGRRHGGAGRRTHAGAAQGLAPVHEGPPLQQVLALGVGYQRKYISPSASAPTTMRYQAKAAKPCRLMKRTKGRTTTRAAKKATTKPSAMVPPPARSSVLRFL